jgi:uncharacterized protein (DUF2141 family)
MLLRIIIFKYLIFLSFPILGQTETLINTTGKLTVKIIGFENNRGDCWFALDNCAEIYESEDSVWIGKILPIKDKQVTVEIDSLKFGEYAVRVYHDENKNAKLDTNFLGIPTEDYGFSNNVSAWFGPPSWDRAKFLFNTKEMWMEIDID